MDQRTPPEAMDAFSAKIRSLTDPADRLDALAGMEAAAPHIVAAELERLADEMASRTVTEEDVRARIAQILGKGDEWCNCQAVRGTVNYPGPWHPAGDTTCLGSRASELRGGRS